MDARGEGDPSEVMFAGSMDYWTVRDIMMYGCKDEANVKFSYVSNKKNKKEKITAPALIAKSGKAVTLAFVYRFCLFVPDLILTPADNRVVLVSTGPGCVERGLCCLARLEIKKTSINRSQTGTRSSVLKYLDGEDRERNLARSLCSTYSVG
jgi:hypothetical protein